MKTYVCVHVEKAPQRNNAREEKPRQQQTTTTDVNDVDAAFPPHPPQSRQSLSTQIASTSLSLIRIQTYKEVASASSLSRTLSLDFIIPCTHLVFLGRYCPWREKEAPPTHAILRKDTVDMQVVMYVSHVACHVEHLLCTHLSLFPLTSPLFSRRVILNEVEDEDEEDDAFLPPSPLSVCDRNMNPKCNAQETKRHDGKARRRGGNELETDM